MNTPTVVVYDEWAPVAACATAVVFLIGYTAIAKWWAHPVGQAVAFLDICLVVALGPSVLHQLFGFNLLHVWYAWYYGSSLYLVGLITLWRLLVIVAVQREAAGPRHRAGVLRQPEVEDEVNSTAD